MSPDKERIPPTMCTGEIEVDALGSPEIGEIADSGVTKRTGSTQNGIAEAREEVPKTVEYIPRIKWPDLIVQIFIHAGCLYGFSLLFTHAKLLTSLWGGHYESTMQFKCLGLGNDGAESSDRNSNYFSTNVSAENFLLTRKNSTEMRVAALNFVK